MKRLTRIALFLALLNVLGLGLLWFEYSTIMAKQSEEVGLRKQIADEKQKGVEFTSIAKIVAQAQKESGALLKYFSDPGEESQIAFIAQMENLGTSTGVTIETKSLELTGGATPSFHGEFAVKGTWRSIYHFLRLLETFPGHLIVSRFTVASADENDISRGMWTGGFTVDLVSLNTPQ